MPPHSIAAGDDFGRLADLEERGIDTSVSDLEQLVLAESRCNQVTFKIVAADAAYSKSKTARGRTYEFRSSRDEAAVAAAQEREQLREREGRAFFGEAAPPDRETLFDRPGEADFANSGAFAPEPFGRFVSFLFD